MLWARDVRRELSVNAELDFATISRKLGEMWANVPANEKYNWRRRAQRLAAKGKERVETGTPAKVPTSTTKFLNRNAPAPPSRSKRNQEKGATDAKPKMILAAKSSGNAPQHSPNGGGGGGIKMSGTAPIDVAAHLKLLGDSLTTIGERLKEHEVDIFFMEMYAIFFIKFHLTQGQITVSGSLSVLLDSLLCSLGPLMCLTTCIPALELDHLKDSMTSTLDNIAYVMPGL